ncbi:MAG: hypothetical protein AAFX46_19380, partial [Cyanobacteria bacterium J06636_27]
GMNSDKSRGFCVMPRSKIGHFSRLCFAVRTPPSSIAGKGKILGDLISPIVEQEDWKCLK